uniref:Uncharacterized protein n=1 Tax=Meloidogyne javanica TaxID=6303 RepID=A0A915MFQ4_MELJA
MSANLDEKLDCSPSVDSKEEEIKPKLTSFGKQIQKDKDPTVLMAREKLLESIKEKDPNQRDKYIEVRSELLKHSEGLLGALALPNYLDVEPEINDRYVLNNYIAKDLDEIVESVRCQQNSNNLTIQLNKLRSSLLNFFIKKLKPAPIHFSGPFLVRPALVECCNICLNEVPLITDCVDPPLCLVVSVKQPEDLQPWERSSLSIDRRFDESGDDKISQIASFSNIGDYISRRAHVVFDTGKNNKNKNSEIDKNPNYAQMAFTTINLDNLIKYNSKTTAVTSTNSTARVNRGNSDDDRVLVPFIRDVLAVANVSDQPPLFECQGYLTINKKRLSRDIGQAKEQLSAVLGTVNNGETKNWVDNCVAKGEALISRKSTKNNGM